MTLAVREPAVSEFRDGAPVPHRGDDVVQDAALGDVVVDVVRRDEGNVRRRAESDPLGETAVVAGVVMEFGEGVEAVTENLAIGTERGRRSSSGNGRPSPPGERGAAGDAPTD